MENQSDSIKGRTDCHPGRDLLSELPSSIIHIILALVPISDAIRTCVLSRQWRYTWTSLLELVFDQCVNRQDKSLKEYEECMQNFITNALFRHKGLIHKFEMNVSFVSSCPRIGDWVLCMSRKDVRELILNNGEYADSYTQDLHSSLYSCEELTSLELWNCALDPPPSTFKGFLFLRHLILSQVYMSPNGIESLVANSPLLESLELITYEEGSVWKISAPNLKHLRIFGEITEICVDAPLLVAVTVHLEYVHLIETSACNYRNFFGGINNLEKLIGFSYFTKFLSIGIEYCYHPLVFHHLSLIHLQDVNFRDVKEVSVIAHLVIGAPNLRELTITAKCDIIEFDEADLEAPHVSYACAPDFKLEKLKFVIMSRVTSHPLEMEFLKFLLERASVLKKISLCPKPTLGFEKVRNLRAELLGCNLASPKAKIWILPAHLRPEWVFPDLKVRDLF